MATVNSALGSHVTIVAFLDQIGWSFHYLVGTIYELFFMYTISSNWFDLPIIINTLLFGWFTISAGWFFIHPCMDFGVALRKTANPNLSRKTGLVAYTAFGLGLWFTTLI